MLPTLPRFAWAALLVLLLAASLAGAETGPTPSPAAPTPKDWETTLARADAYVRAARPDSVSQLELSAALQQVDQLARARRADIAGEIDQLNGLLKALGPPPAQGAPPEAADLEQRRRELNDQIADARARLAETDLAIARAASLQQELSRLYRQTFWGNLLERQGSPLAAESLAGASADLVRVSGALLRRPVDAVLASLSAPDAASRWSWPFAAVMAAALLGAWRLRRIVLRRYGPDPAQPEPGYARRLLGGLATVFADGLLPTFFLAALYYWVAPGVPFVAPATDSLLALFLFIAFLVLVVAAARAGLVPRLAGWGLTGAPPAIARRIAWWVIALAIVFAVDQLLVALAGEPSPSAGFISVYALLFGAAEAAAIVGLGQPSLWRAAQPTGDGEVSRGIMLARALRNLISLLAVAGVAAIALGYVRLGRFVIANLIETGLVVAGLILVRGLAMQLLGWICRPTPKPGGAPARAAIPWAIEYALRGLVDLALIALAADIVLPFWGVPPQDLGRWTQSVINGVSIGSATVSPLDIGLAILVLIAGLLITRLIREDLTKRLLPGTGLDPGIQNSISIGVGYAGITLTVLLAVSAGGISLSSLLIVAGALGVGIGFGLQTIVNNFVSGLILLVERPVKVGDWVVVGGFEGNVRRINVRSTEIETFDRATVFVPNSQLVTAAVINYTYRNRFGRAQVRVAVAADTDKGQVRDLLLGCARAHKEVAMFPAVDVSLDDIGGGGAVFTLSAYVDDVNRKGVIATDLRIAIDAALAAAGIRLAVQHIEVALPGATPGEAVIR
jgi:small-conductance mechanosensitive channel